MNIIKKSLFLTIFTLILSCQAVLVKITTPKSIQKKIKVLHKKDTDQTIVFFPMSHVGKISYYESCKPIIDSLRNKGYVIFYESVAIKDSLDSDNVTEYKKKFRKILGFHLSENKELLPDEYHIKNYTIQDYGLMGLNSNDKILDLGINRIIDAFEKSKGEIVLNECDLETPLNEKYDCKNKLNQYKFYITNKYRDDYIFSELKKMTDNKIVLVYGESHWYFIYADLVKHGYKLVRGKI